MHKNKDTVSNFLLCVFYSNIMHHWRKNLTALFSDGILTFLVCPRYAAQCNLLLTSAARILGETWSSSSDARKINNFFLFGTKSVNYDINCTLFREVQTFIIDTSCFSMATV